MIVRLNERGLKMFLFIASILGLVVSAFLYHTFTVEDTKKTKKFAAIAFAVVITLAALIIWQAWVLF